MWGPRIQISFGSHLTPLALHPEPELRITQIRQTQPISSLGRSKIMLNKANKRLMSQLSDLRIKNWLEKWTEVILGQMLTIASSSEIMIQIKPHEFESS